LLYGRLLDLQLHLQAGGPLPAPGASVLPDDVGDADHVCGNFEEYSEVPNQVVSEELGLRHGGQIEGDDEDGGGADLHRLGALHHHLQHLVLPVEVVVAVSAIQRRDVLTLKERKCVKLEPNISLSHTSKTW